MKQITIWDRYNKDKEDWEHNHISDGYDKSIKIPISDDKEQTKKWSKGIWKSKVAYLDKENQVWYVTNRQTPRSKVCDLCFESDVVVNFYYYSADDEYLDGFWCCIDCVLKK